MIKTVVETDLIKGGAFFIPYSQPGQISSQAIKLHILLLNGIYLVMFLIEILMILALIFVL